MTRVNVDATMRTDPRFHVLASLLGESVRESRDRTIDVWFACSNARSATIPASWVDIAADRQGFAEALVQAELGTWVEPDRIRINGVEERIRYLKDLQSRARTGGVESGAQRRKQTLPDAGSKRFESAEANASHAREPNASQKRNPLTLALSPALSPENSELPENPLNPPFSRGESSRRRGVKRAKKEDVSPEASRIATTVLKALGEYSGVGYRVTAHHAQLIASRVNEGLSILDLRKVAWYCAEILDWKSDSKFRHYLRPETLYGPKTIIRYLDPARAEYRKQFGTDEDVNSETNPENGEGGGGNGHKGTP